MRTYHLLPFVALVGFVLPAQAQTPPDPPPKPRVVKWQVFKGADVEATITFRAVTSKSGTRYRSWKLRYKDKKRVGRLGVLQIRPDGGLARYRRVLTERLGAGVIAFSRGNTVRIVGKNQRRRQVELEAAYHGLWDPMGWLTLWDWAPKLIPARGVVRTPMYNVQSGTQGTAESTPTPSKLFKGENDTPVAMTKWRITGLGNSPLTVYVARGRLYGVVEGARVLLREGYKLQPAPPKPEPVNPETKNGNDATQNSTKKQEDGVGP